MPLQAAGTAVTVTNAYPKAGLTGAGATTPARWSVAPGGAVTVAVRDRRHHAQPERLHRHRHERRRELHPVRLKYAAGDTPPSRLQCSTDSGSTFVDC